MGGGYVVHVSIFIIKDELDSIISLHFDSLATAVIFYLAPIIIGSLLSLLLIPIVAAIRRFSYIAFRKQINEELGLDNTADRYGIKGHYSEKVLSDRWKEVSASVKLLVP